MFFMLNVKKLRLEFWQKYMHEQVCQNKRKQLDNLLSILLLYKEHGGRFWTSLRVLLEMWVGYLPVDVSNSSFSFSSLNRIKKGNGKLFSGSPGKYIISQRVVTNLHTCVYNLYNL